MPRRFAALLLWICRNDFAVIGQTVEVIVHEVNVRREQIFAARHVFRLQIYQINVRYRFFEQIFSLFFTVGWRFSQC